MIINDICHSCGGQGVSIFYRLYNVPVHSVALITTPKLALNYPKGEIALGFCKKCGFISNTAFDPELVKYSSGYESTQVFSPTFNAFAYRLAAQLIERHNIYNKTVLEIGCGNGEFLSILCELGDNQGVGFDPAYESERSPNKAKKRFKVIKDYYSEKYVDYHADFVCCRMTLEHIQFTADFVKMVRRSVGDRAETIIFFQIPDVTRILRDCAFEDIYYEHCSYFSTGSLARMFRKYGFDVIRLETDYDGQYLMIEAKPANQKPQPPLPQEDDLETLGQYVLSFENRCQEKLFQWKKRIEEIRKTKGQIVIWGSGSKGVSFLTTLQIRDEIKYVVDINPNRHGTYMPVTGQKIVSPEFLVEYRPDVVIVMNAVYINEIKQDLGRLDLTPKVLTL